MGTRVLGSLLLFVSAGCFTAYAAYPDMYIALFLGIVAAGCVFFSGIQVILGED